MKINAISPSFGKTYVNYSKMTKNQYDFYDSFSMELELNDEYIDANEKDIDFYVMPENKESISINIVDIDSQQIIKDDNYKDLRFILNPENLSKNLKLLFNSLKKINNNEIKRPKVDADLIANAQTDVAKFRPELYERMKKIKEDSYGDNELAADIFIAGYKKSKRQCVNRYYSEF